MNKKEITDLLSRLKVAFASSFSKFGANDLEILYELWEETFQKHKYEVVKQALQNIILTSSDKWMPNISEIVDEVLKITTDYGQQLTAYQALGELNKYFDSNDYFSPYEERINFNELPELVQKTIEAMGGEDRLKHAYGSDVSKNSYLNEQFVKIYTDFYQQKKRSYINMGYEKPKLIEVTSQKEEYYCPVYPLPSSIEETKKMPVNTSPLAQIQSNN